MKKVGMKTLGLTLGKFAPLHKGHQFMIETALQEVDELIVVIYETKVTPIPHHVRANWIRRLYPEVRVIEAWDGPDGYSDNREHIRARLTRCWRSSNLTETISES